MYEVIGYPIKKNKKKMSIMMEQRNLRKFK
jgi:hypothetical protein